MYVNLRLTGVKRDVHIVDILWSLLRTMTNSLVTVVHSRLTQGAGRCLSDITVNGR